MLEELQVLEREDRVCRQKSLARIPVIHIQFYNLVLNLLSVQPNMFQPAHRRIEMAAEQQRDMEGAFERLFVRTAHHEGPLPAQSLPTTVETESGSSLGSFTPSGHDTQPLDRGQFEPAPASPKVTPDSGVHVDSTPSAGSSRQQNTSSIDIPDNSLLTSVTVDPLSSEQSTPEPMAATFSSTDSEGAVTQAMATQTPRLAPRQITRPGYSLNRPELTVADTTSSDDQSTQQGSRGTSSKKSETLTTVDLVNFYGIYVLY